MQIRLATEKDVIGIVYVQATTWISQYPNPSLGITTEDIKAIDWQGKVPSWQHMVKSPDYTVLVATEGENILGFATVTKTSTKAELYALYVLPEHQRRGIGSSLMKEVLDRFNQDMFLQVATYNTDAQRFYTRYGFKSCGTYGSYKLPGGKDIPTLNMQKSSLDSNLSESVSRKQLAEITGVRQSTIKWYTESGLLPFTQTEEKRRRYYDREEASRRLEYIKRQQGKGMSLDDIAKNLSSF